MNVYKIKEGLTKDEALKLEGELISKLHPRFNVDRKYYHTETLVKQNKNDFIKNLSYFCEHLTEEKKSHLIFIVSSFIDCFGFKNIKVGLNVPLEDIQNSVRCGSFITMLENTLLESIFKKVFNYKVVGSDLYIAIKQNETY